MNRLGFDHWDAEGDLCWLPAGGRMPVALFWRVWDFLRQTHEFMRAHRP